MKNTKSVSIIALLLAFIMLAMPLLSSCSNNAESEESQTSASIESIESDDNAETEAPDRFKDVDLGGMQFRILVSATDYDSQGSSIFTIRHEEGEADALSDVVNDAVYRRNTEVEEKLNIDFVFIDTEEYYDTLPATMRKLVASGDDIYELVIQELFPLATLSVEGTFLNARSSKYFDFSQPWWYEDYMKDLALGSDDFAYILAGDYFMDILRSAHALYFNKDMFSNIYESPAQLYDHVRAGTWTQDVLLEYMKGCYSDLNGDGVADKDDQYGLCFNGRWGAMIPFVVSSNITFYESESDGHPVLAMNNERSVKLLENLNKIFWSEDGFDYAGDNNQAFMSGKSVFGGYQRVRSLEMFRDMEYDLGILPYPKMDSTQDEYITASHDTANVGVILSTTGKLDEISAVVELLSQKTYESVMPSYYETALKVKYSRDDDSAQMLDIIRGNISCVFPVAFGNYCENYPLYNAFSVPLVGKKTDFASTYASNEKKVQIKLDELWAGFASLNP